MQVITLSSLATQLKPGWQTTAINYLQAYYRPMIYEVFHGDAQHW